MKKFLKIAGGVLILSLVIVLAGATIAGAQEATPETVTPDTPDTPAPFGPPEGFTPWGRGRHGMGPIGGGRGQFNMDAMHQALADALGISVEELDAARAEGTTITELADELDIELEAIQEAMQAVHADALAQAVEDGLLTQEQADAILERSGSMPFGGGFRGPHGGYGFGGPRGGHGFGGHGFVDNTVMHEAIANALGLSVEEFDAARAEGTTLVELAEAQGVDLADIQAAMEAVREEALAQAVEDGLITQEQADAILSRSGQMGNCDGLGGGKRGGFNGGHRGGMGGMRGGFGGGYNGGPSGSTFGNGPMQSQSNL